MAADDSLGNQFNKQYQETIDLVKSRAIWRIGEKLSEGEAFRCHCSQCRFESLHQRFDIPAIASYLASRSARLRRHDQCCAVGAAASNAICVTSATS